MSAKANLPTDPEVLAFIEETARHYPETSNRASPEEARRAYDTLCEAFEVSHPPGAVTNDTVVKAQSPTRSIAIRRYRDEDDEASSSCLMYLHGGGWIVGGLESHDSICAELCVMSGMDVVAVDYRLCPEHRHPAALDDAEAVYMKLCDEGKQVIVGGDSAGAHLAAALCLRLRDAGAALPAAQLLIYPGLGATPEGGSYESNANAPGLTTADVIHYWGVLSDGADWRTTSDAELAPLRAADLSGLPPAIISSAGFDPLRDDAMLYANRLTEAGVPVVWRNDPQLVHGHLRARHMSDAASASFIWICLALNEFTMNAALDELMSDDDIAALFGE